jgi:hypothetical protein
VLAVLSITLGVVAQQLAKHKTIVTRITAFEELAGVTIVRSDKKIRSPRASLRLVSMPTSHPDTWMMRCSRTAPSSSFRRRRHPPRCLRPHTEDVVDALALQACGTRPSGHRVTGPNTPAASAGARRFQSPQRRRLGLAGNHPPRPRDPPR